ncbi:hypothetical protein HD553DRAFT_269487 [Filobasidium floriforme]|uniref:uncharacterized protein n=1 Tax=Filobasidium floriforme TaxID=5210 RepID=UPI001E8ED374|nr:uncharacterized protein HD553DRAFT_269487 [Filobasidium floriforme]KAH8087913.1 hypothetical protein HD553DRAFT_269487 [Filobasidium floriforme]
MNTLTGAGGGAFFGGGRMGGARSDTWTKMLKDLKSPKPASRYSALQEATTTIALAQEDQFHYFPWEDAVKVFLGLMSGKPIVEGKSDDESKDEGAVEAHDEDDFDSMTEEQQMMYAMALSSGGKMPSADAELDPEQDQQAQLLACRCLQNLMMSSEGHGMTAGYIVRNGGVKVLCDKLTSIENIELAEQVIVTLAKLAEYQSRGTGIIQENGLKIMLDILDFFDIHVQKSIVSAVIFSCRYLTAAEFPKIKEILPHIRGLLARSDSALVEGAANIMYRLLNSYVYKADILEDILDREMIDAINGALLPGSGSPQISPSVYANLLKVLTAGVRSSAKVTMTLFEADFPRTIYFILTGLLPPDEQDIAKGQTDAPAEAVILQNLGTRAKEQIEEVLNLACELLPPAPQDGVFDPRNYSERMLARYAKAKDKLQRQIDKVATATPPVETPQNETGTSTPQAGSSVPQAHSLGISGLNQAMERNKVEAQAAVLKRQEVLQENAEVVNTFSKILIPVLVDVYNASAALKVRTRILATLQRSIAFCTDEQLTEALQNVSFASFLSSILTSRDNPALVTNALQLAELLLFKLPAIYTRSFQREGVFYEIDKLAGEELSPSASATPSTLLKALAGEDLTQISAFERALGVARAKPGSSSRRVSSVPSNPHDANIVRAKILQIKRWSLSDTGRAVPSSSSTVAEVIQQLSDPEITDDDLQKAFTRIAELLTDRMEPLSSFEMLQSGLLAKLMGMLQEGEKAVAHRNILFAALAETPADSDSSPLALLVKRLQDSLSRLDNFEVETTNGGAETDPKRTLPSLLRTMTVQLSAGSDSPLPINWKAKVIEISLPCVAPISSMNSFLRSSSRISGTGSGAAVKSDLDALLDAGTAGSASASASKQPAATEAKPAARRSARLRGETVEDAEPTSNDAAVEGPAESDALKQPEDFAVGEDDDDHSTQNDEDADEHEHGEEGMPAAHDIHQPDGSKPQGITPHGTRVATPTPEASAADTSRVAGVPPRTRSYAAALKAPTTDYHYRFSHNGHDLGYQESLYGAISRVKRMSGTSVRLSFYDRQILHVRKVEGPAPLPEIPKHVDPASEDGLPGTLKKESPQATVLLMLRIIHAINEEQRDKLGEVDSRVLDEGAFINAKMTAKFIRQLDEILLVACEALPSWATELPKSFRFLFPFEARYTFMQSTAFGLPRLCQRHMSAAASGGQSRQNEYATRYLPLPRRQPLRIDRRHMLMSVRRAMELWGQSAYILDYQYIDEHGTGLGPTLEFYSLASKAFAARSNRMWRDEDPSKGDEWVHHPHGLFPRPFSAEDKAGPASDQDMAPIFQGLGMFVGRALYDSRIIDLHFNKVFLKAILGDHVDLSLDTLKLVDPELARTMSKLEKLLAEKQEIDAEEGIGAAARSQAYEGLNLDGASIDDLALDFTLPGYADVPLKENGSNVNVDLDNLEEYIELVYKVTLQTGIAKSVDSFREGFSRIFPIKELSIFSPEEMGLLFGNPDEDWSRETVELAIKADHGYHSDSKQVRFLIDLMTGYTKQERRTFLRFITGAPKLPLGGFKSLHPQFTVVRKREPPPFKPDDYLPSVMTCAQYLKLPEYSTKEIMESQLHRAMHEGAEGFLLS